MNAEIVLGLLQGTLEWLPVSSQGMAVLAGRALGFDGTSSFDISLWLHVGTLFAALFYFRREMRGEFSFLAEATMASAVTGFPAYLLAEAVSSLAGSWLNIAVGFSLIALAFLQGRLRVGGRPAFVAGLAQGLAVVPGVSRSAITVLALTAAGLAKEEALEKSFLMSIPAVAALTLARLSILGASSPPLLGIATAALAGYLSIGLLLSLARRVDFKLFCLSFGCITFLSTLF